MVEVSEILGDSKNSKEIVNTRVRRMAASGL